MKNVFALAGMLVLSLLTSVTLGSERPIEYYDPSSSGFYPEAGVLKGQNDCPAGTAFFKNQFPGLTNGPGGTFAELTFLIDGTGVTFRVDWFDENSFSFSVLGGVAHIVGVTSDTNNLLYDYVNFYPAVNTLGPNAVNAPVSADGDLNKISDAADVNHLDLCLAVADPGDIIDPEVTIILPTADAVVSGGVTVVTIATDNDRVSSVTASIVGTQVNGACSKTTGDEFSCLLDTTSLSSGSYTILVSATDGSGNTGTSSVEIFLDYDPPVVTIDSPEDTTPPAQVSGEVTVVATVIDGDSDVDPDSVTATVYQGDVEIEVLGLDPNNPPAMDEYTWLWDTGPLPAGFYEIRVSAADTFGNTTEPPASVTVEAVKLFTDCFGTLGDEDFDPDNPTESIYAGGCKPTDLIRVQTAPDTEACAGDNPPNFCFLAGTLLKPANGTAHCGDYGFPDPRMKLVDNLDPRCSDLAGCWVPDVIRELRFFDPLENIGIDPLLVPRVVDSLPPNNMLADAVVLDENTYCANGCCAIAQHVKGYANGGVSGDELNVLYPVWPQNPATGLIFIKTHFPAEVLDPALVCECYDEIDNPDLQKACGAGYSPLDQQLDDYGFLSVLTQKCVNPARTLTRNNGFDVSNIVETAGINFDTDPVAVLSFKYGLAEDQFGLVFAALDCAAPLLLTGKFSDVSSPVNQAKRRFDNLNPSSLQRSIDALKDAADAIRTQTTWLVTERNCPGEALGRIEHLIWDLGLLKRELERLEGLGVL